MSDEDFDPEIAADIALRERTARERPRVSDAEFSRRLAQAAGPEVIDRVPCRGRCGRVVDWTQEAEDAFLAFNRKLARGVEAPLDKTRIVFCVECRARGKHITADANRKQVDAIAALVRELRGGTTAPVAPGPAPRQEREREIIDKLRKLNHPDVDALVESIRAARDSKAGRGRAAKGAM